MQATRPPVPDADFMPTVAEELGADDSTQSLSAGAPTELQALEALTTIGQVGRYALKYRLGQGGLGTVHAALDPLLSRPIAVKTLHLEGADAAQREALEALLLNEARAAAGLKHPNIVTVYDAGLSEHGVYITMERLQGRDLRQALAEGWRPEPLQAAQIVRRVADALAYAHSRGVVHCDIKPANIFMVSRTQPTVLDFGIARVAQRGDVAGKPTDHLAAGSPLYMAPEQLRGEALDARCDVYSLGVVLHELLTGRRAFDGSSLDAIQHAVLNAEVPPAHLLNPAVPAALSAIAQRAMQRVPDDRYRSARQLARALRVVLGDAAAAEPSGWRRRGLLAAALAGGLLLVGALVWRSTQRPAPGLLAGAASTAAPAASTPALPADPASASALAAEAAPPDAAASLPANEATQLAAAPAASAAAPPPRAKRVAREARPQPAAAAVEAPPPQGLVHIAVSPWGTVEVDGRAVGTAPPLNQLSLPEGSHRIVLRNEDFAPHSTTVTVTRDQPVTIKHRFGS
jgi:serine/threonine-protein kinase